MSFRVTQNMLSTQLMRNLNKSMLKMEKQQEQLSTGRKLNKPSDDPVGVTYALRYRSDLSSNEQYQRNVDAANSWLEFTDTVLGQAGDVFQRAKELVVKGSTGTNPQSALDAIKKEIDALNEQMVEVGNSKFNGKYIFNGQLTDIEPYSIGTAPSVVTDTKETSYEVGAGIKLNVSVTGNSVFGKPGDNDNVFKVLGNISNALSNGDYDGVAAELENIESRMDTLLSMRSEIGARVNRTELIENRLKDINLNLTELQSKVEDADLAEVATNAKMTESIYQAALSVGSKIITPSLVDFLR